MLKLTKKGLYITDLCLWLFAGVKVLTTGYSAWLEVEGGGRQGEGNGHLLAIALVTFVVFRSLIFRPAMMRNLRYIQALEGKRHPFYQCMRPAAWIIMACMIVLGLSLRFSGLVPLHYIASFYSGLGLALAAAGLDYLPWISGSKK